MNIVHSRKKPINFWVAAVVAAALSLGTSPGDARADKRSAREHYQKGTVLFDLGRYKEAAAAYERGFAEQPDPALLFNVGQAYRLARDFERAVTAYRGYLRRFPDAPNRAEVEARIAEMRRLLEEQQAAQERPPTGTTPPAADPPPERPAPGPALVAAPARATPPPLAPRRGLRNAGIGLLAGAGAALAFGVASTAVAAQSLDGLALTYDETLDSRRATFAALQWVGYGVAAAAAVAGGALLGLQRQAPSRHARIGVGAGPGGFFLSLRTSF